MSKRTEQVAELLRIEVNNILIRDFEPPMGSLVSVSRITISPDLKNATAYLSVIPDNKLGSALSAVKKFNHHIHKELNKKIVTKIVPKLHWQIDDTDLKYKAIDEALNN
jgi:ribosome-binding factor A